jgi:superfamily II DNA/RNA helicase
VKKIVIFGETKFGVQRLSDELEKNGFSSRSIHGDKNQAQRTRAIKAFRNGNADILVATDVAARGLDIPDVSHVINFDTPNSYEDYIHRIGRTGRGGKSGSALTFVKARKAKDPEVKISNNPRRKASFRK